MAHSPDWMRERVLELLDGNLVPGDAAGVKALITEDCPIVFPGFAAVGHAGVDQLYAILEVAFDGVPTKSYDLWVFGDDAVNLHGSLYGRFKDGRVMDGTRYTDTFRFAPDGRITHWLVFNDLSLLPA